MTQSADIDIGKSNKWCGNIINSFNTNTIDKSYKGTQILHWLSPLEPNNRHEGVRTGRLTGIRDWLLETPEFQVWRSGEGGVDKAVLFCNGNPGVGKTYLSSLVIDRLYDDARKENIAVAGLYCDYLAQQEQTVANVMGAILKQLVSGGGISKDLRDEFQKEEKEHDGRELLLPDLMKMLTTAIASLPQVFICIDALDEFSAGNLLELLKLLSDIVRESHTARIFLTGRQYVRKHIQKHFSNAVIIPICPNTDDIRGYLEMRLDRDTNPEAMNDDLRANIIRVILEKISDIFLLVSLSIDAILGELTISQRRKKLEETTKGIGLSDAYTATLGRLRAQKKNESEIGLRVLMWVLYSERPLRTVELRHALGVKLGSTDLDAENIPALRTLLASCLGLVTVEASSSTVRLVHYSLKEHFSTDPTLFHRPNTEIAEVCLTYLNFKCVRDLPPTVYWAPAETPLLEYASYYWGEHTRRGMTKNVKKLALRLLDRFDEHISAQLMLLRYNGYRGSGPYFDGWGGPIGFTGLHGAAFIGIAEIVAAILNMKEWGVGATDSTGSTALIWAAARGHEEVVKILLGRRDVNSDQADTHLGQTPLLWAAKNGHEGIVKMFLERRDVNPDQPDTEYGLTPLSWVANMGNEGIVKMLLQRENVKADCPDTEYGLTPLSWAADTGHGGIVKMLLERADVNPNQSVTKYGETPLLWAAENGHEGVVEVLLKRKDVCTATSDGVNQKALSLALSKGHDRVVKLLRQRDSAKSDTTDHVAGHPSPRKSETGPHDPRTILTYLRPVDWYFTTASVACLVALLVYILPSSLPELFPRHK